MCITQDQNFKYTHTIPLSLLFKWTLFLQISVQNATIVYPAKVCLYHRISCSQYSILCYQMATSCNAICTFAYFILTKVVSSNPAYGEVHSMQHYVIRLTGRWFSPGNLVSSTNKIGSHDITEILLKVALNIITLTPLKI